ncbi:TIGR02206 family membrane protein [Corynebacterium nasicanis]
MALYSPEHWAALLVIAVATPLFVRAARRGSGRWMVLAGWVLLAISVAWGLWDLRPSVFDIQRSLPLQLSDLARLTTSLALITGDWRWIAPTYYWGLTLNVQSLLTPDLSYAVDPRLEYHMYWLLHGAVLIAPIALVWGRGHRPTWAWYRYTWLLSLGWMATTMLVNVATDSNYGYLNGTPPGRSLLDVMGPWPTYLAVGCGALGVVWAGMTWPWGRLRRSRSG